MKGEHNLTTFKFKKNRKKMNEIQQLTETRNDNKLKTLNLFKIINNTTTIQSIKITPKKNLNET